MATAAIPNEATRFTWRSAAATSKGNVRSHNEDSILDLSASGLWVVADGMGGHNAGDVASRMIVEALASVSRHSRPSELVDEVEDRLSEVNDRLYRASLENEAGMSGSTVTVLLALERHCLSLWAGDSRIYRSREGVLTQVTRDHSEVQEMLDTGALTQAAAENHCASNIITRAVGGTAELFLDIELRELRHNDRYLLCSDGLYKEIPEADIARHLSSNDPEGACNALMKQALSGQCSDNVSAIVVQFSAA
ncbi:MAG TPA: protein phosphatase 2C domain-containing protein [Steroidobacteraceae bacterium]